MKPATHPIAARRDNCPTCDSPAPHLHPAVQYGGEVQPCRDRFHDRETPQNRRRSHPIAARPALPVGPHLHAEAERAELERLTALAAPLMDAIPASLQYRLEHVLLQASAIHADRLIRRIA